MIRRFPDEIEQWIPHRGRMKMVERVVEVCEEYCVTEAVVGEDWPTACADGVSAVVLIDLVAQSAAAFSSWEHQHDEEPGQGGFIVGIRRAVWTQSRLHLGAVLRTTVRSVMRIQNYASFQASVAGPDGFTSEIDLQAFRP